MAPAPQSRSKTGGKLFGGGLIGGGALLLADYLGGINKFQDWAEDLFDPQEGDRLCPKSKKSPPQGFDRGQPPFIPPNFPRGPKWPDDDRDDDDDDFCTKRWNQEYDRCDTIPYTTKNAANWRRACRERASIRRDLCIRNGGVPDPFEPREWPG